MSNHPQTCATIARRDVAAECGRAVTPPKKLAERLQALSYAARDLGIRAADVAAFRAVASATDTIILLRAINPASLPYVGRRGYTAKPIDCKAKTADTNQVQSGHVIECAGLVVDPTRVPGKAFRRRQDATGADRVMQGWEQMTRAPRSVRVSDRAAVFLRAQGKGFYAVDSARPSTLHRHHGCMMLSLQDVPPDFDPASRHTRMWMRQHMAYPHGDYGLYGIIDVDSVLSARGMHREPVFEKRLLDQPNYVTRRSHEPRAMLNAAIGCEMVQHGEQAAYAFTADDSRRSGRRISSVPLSRHARWPACSPTCSATSSTPRSADGALAQEGPGL